MILRFVLAIVALVLSLAISADNRSIECVGCWMAAPNSPTVEESLGVNIHFVDSRPGEVRMIADAGFRWVRTDFKWDVTERDRGRYDFSSYDRLLKELEANHLRALFILDYGNPLYTEGMSVRTAEARHAFAKWSVAAAKHFAGRGIVWEVFNEPNIPVFWPPDPDVQEYVALAAEVSRAFQAEAPQESLIGPATSKIDLPFLTSCFEGNLPENWSGISVHPYRATNPETAVSEYARLRELINKYSGRGEKPLNIISSEWGYSSAWPRMNEQRQAVMLARQFLTNVANGIPLSIWYDWRDDGTDPNEGEHHFGLVRHEYKAGSTPAYEPKPAFLAARTLTTMLKGFRFQQRLNAGGPEDYVLSFVKSGELRIVAWTTSTAPRRVAIPQLSDEFSVTTMSGRDGGRVRATHDGLMIDLSTSPVYLVAAF